MFESVSPDDFLAVFAALREFFTLALGTEIRNAGMWINRWLKESLTQSRRARKEICNVNCAGYQLA